MTDTTELCNYTGMDSTAVIASRPGDNGAVHAYSRCHCGEVTCERGTPEQADQALADHRAPAQRG